MSTPTGTPLSPTLSDTEIGDEAWVAVDRKSCLVVEPQR